MKRNIKGYAIKLTSALFIAAAIMSVGTTVARADEINTQPTECVETVVEGQGDVIDDDFAYVEGQGDVIDDEFAYVEGQGDVIDDEFAVSEEEAWEAANEIRTAEMAKCFGEFGTVEMDLHNAEWYQEYQKAQEAKKAEEERAKQFEEIAAELNAALKPSVDAMIQARLMEDTKAAVKESETKNVKAPAVDMSFYHYTFIGYHGDRVDYEDLVPGKFYLMQIPGKTSLPSFSYKVVKINGSYTDNGREMVTYDKYDTNGKLEGRNRKAQGNVTPTHLKPNHFFELTDDILVK